MKENLKVLFFGRKNCIYSRKIYFEIKKQYSKTKLVLSQRYGQKITKDVLNWKGDYIFCFRSFYDYLPRGDTA